MAVAILSGLSREEAEAFIASAAHRHPAIPLSILEREGSSDVCADDEDAARYADVLQSLVAKARPTRLRLQEMEMRIATHLRRMLDTGNFAYASSGDSPLHEICLELEYKLVAFVASEGDFVDGFAPGYADPVGSGIFMRGACWLFEGPNREQRFEADISLHDDGTLARLDLRFGDKELFASLPPAPNDASLTERHGYFVTHGARDQNAPWVYRIVKSENAR